MGTVLRILLRTLIGVVVVCAALAALFLYLIYTPSPEAPQLSSTRTRGTIDIRGLTRTYLTYVPRDLPKGAPLVVVLHGSGESGARIRVETGYGFDRLADTRGFAVAYPDAFDGYWDICAIVGAVDASAHNVDDMAFLSGLIDKLAADIGIDPGRAFAAGSSRGGSMALRIALELPARYRAVAAVSGSLPTPENFKCKPAGPGTSVMIMNGTADPIVPFDGGEVNLFGVFYRNGKVRSTRDTAQYFADFNHITGKPETNESPASKGMRVERVLWRGDSKAEVELVAIHGAGHGMPQPYTSRPRILGPSSNEPNGPAVIWEFFDRQPRR
jgi:polyhydroxybutyrate depolymerase